jgi:pimeloyl-ACP methyl ester carboxylesterase
MHKQRAVETNSAVLHYTKYGTGSKALLCFHGYGQNHTVFQSLIKHVDSSYSIYAFDLFYHGQSFWHKKTTPICHDDWKQLVNRFLIDNQIDTFTAIGFSMGSRFAISTAASFPEHTKQLILLAPDGIQPRRFYWFMTNFVFTRALLRYVILKPALFNITCRMLLKWNWINKGVLKFSESQMQTKEMRRRVYYSWVTFRKLFVNPTELVQLLKQHSVSTKVYLGTYDKVITKQNIKPLKKLWPSSIHSLQAGHTNLLQCWINDNQDL